MPSISTRGAGSSYGYGWGAVTKFTPIIPGDKAVISTSGSTSSTLYSFSNRTMTAGTNFTSSMGASAAVSNSTYALFTIGSGTLAGSVRYSFATETSSNGPTFGVMRPNSGGTANDIMGIFFVSGGTNWYTYIFASNLVGGGGVVSPRSGGPNACSNKQFAICFLGDDGQGSTKFTYATLTHAAGPAMGFIARGGYAAGNADRGIYTTGYGTSTAYNATVSIPWATLVVSVTTNIGSTYYSGACGNDEYGIWGTVTGTTPITLATMTYVWATDVVAAGTSLLSPSSYTAMASNGTTGVNI